MITVFTPQVIEQQMVEAKVAAAMMMRHRQPRQPMKSGKTKRRRR
jgi:hypothetical protein